jgi:DNA mismatch repair protein MutS
MGGRKLRRWILHPLLDLKRIKFRQACVNEFFKDPSLTADLQEQLKQVADLERLSGKIGLNNANARDLLSLKDSLNKALAISETIKPIKDLKKLSEQIESNRAKLKDCIKVIAKGIAKNPPNTITEGEIIKDGYSEKINKIRSDTKDSRDWIKNLAKKERERTGIPSLKVDSNKVFGYYIEVTNTHTDKVPDDYIRKQTLVNSERYITPELKKKEEVVFNAKEKLAELEYKCFLEIREKILKYIDLIQAVGSDIATIDVLISLAEAARLNDYTCPDLYDMGERNGIIDIKNSRHPVVEKYSDEEFIKNDVNTDTDKNRLLILTGPNMSGKSTYIRQAALLILMAQIGSFVPAERAQISLADRIFTRVGASDDIAGGRSTFLVEMDEASNIINNATQHSFIVLDEIGRGTSTYDGVSIAWAVSEFIHDNLGARCMFATHYHELLKLSELLEGVKNYNVAVVEKDDKITFLRKIEEGGTDKSYGIFVAQMAGLPESLIERAREILNGFEQENMFAVRSDPSSLSQQKDSKEIKKQQSAPNGDQLTFMDNSLAKTIPNVFKEIEEIDINHITPVEALKLIEKWKKTLDGK